MNGVIFAGPHTPGAWGDLLASCLPPPRHRGLPIGVELKPCGTVAAYQRHMRRNEDACPACRTAVKAAYDARRAQ